MDDVRNMYTAQDLYVFIRYTTVRYLLQNTLVKSAKAHVEVHNTFMCRDKIILRDIQHMNPEFASGPTSSR
jgi:hypothetical protein